MHTGLDKEFLKKEHFQGEKVQKECKKEKRSTFGLCGNKTLRHQRKNIFS